MIYVDQGKIPPKEWIHNPEIVDNTNYTVALMLAD